MNRCSSAIQENLALLYHRNVQVLDVFISRILLEIAGATASFITLSVFFIGIESIQPPVDALKVVFGWFMLAWFGSSLALAIGAATAYSEIVDRIWHPTAYLLFPLSGAAFMVEWMPPAAREYILLLPMVHGVELVREGYFGNVVRTHYDMGYMATINLVVASWQAWCCSDMRPSGSRRMIRHRERHQDATTRDSGHATCWTAST